LIRQVIATTASFADFAAVNLATATVAFVAEPQQNYSKMDFAHCCSESFELNLFDLHDLKFVDQPIAHLSKVKQQEVRRQPLADLRRSVDF
jgi:hypothetical protein